MQICDIKDKQDFGSMYSEEGHKGARHELHFGIGIQWWQ